MPYSPLVADFLIAVLAAWLGAGVVTRAPRDRVARVFGWLTFLTALWGATRVIWRLTGDAGVAQTVRSVEAGVATFLPAALLHLILAFIAGPRRGPAANGTLAVAYGVGAVAGILSIADPARPLAITPPHREFPGIPGAVLGWAWVGFRALVFALAVWWAWRAWRAEGRNGPRRAQLGAVLAAVATAAAGGIITILGRQLRGLEELGPPLVAVALGLTAYAVFGRRVLLSPEAARRSFYYSLVTGLLTAGYVAILLGLDRLARAVLKTEAPLVTTLALVLTIALFDPVRERVRALLDRRAARRERNYRRLLRALGDELLTAPRPEAAVASALERIGRTLRLGAAAVITPDGRSLATYGPPAALDGAGSPAASSPLLLPLHAGGREFGQALFGAKRSGAPYTEAEIDLLDDAATFIAASLQLAERQAAEAAALDALQQERAALQVQEAALADALVATMAEAPAEPAADPKRGDDRLHVFALGPLRVERGGEPIRRWGGAKAGTRQAEALFAFLFDRGERGVVKDEALELIWPDVPLDKADLAFHRTLGGLRRTLEPDLRRGSDATSVTFHNDRYRLDGALIAWSDVAAFEERIAAAGAAPDPAGAIAGLEGARALYRGEFLDDCPFYGDSEFVEERRALLRGRYVDVCLALGERYEAAGDRPGAAAAFREALRAAGDDCPRADAGLERLGLPV